MIMGIKCRIFEHDFKISEEHPSQTFKIPAETEHPHEYLKRTTKLIEYECSRCNETKEEQIDDEELVIDDWKSAGEGEDSKNKESKRISSQRQSSRQAHKEAQKREVPVSIGDVIRGGVENFTHHHSGRIDAIIRYNTFVVFVRDVPEDVQKGDIVKAKVTSFGKEDNCAYSVLNNSPE